MRITTTGVVSMLGLLFVTAAVAQPRPEPPPPPAPVPMPVMPPTPPVVQPPGQPAPQPVPGQPVPGQPAPEQPPPPAEPPRAPTVPPPTPGSDAPPPPPPPGQRTDQPEPPPAPAPLPVEATGNAGRGGELAGWHGSFFLRDPHDNFRLYPRGRLHIDFNGFAGPGVSSVKGVDGGTALASRLFVRRLRLELAGEFFKRFSFILTTDLGGQPLTNANGKTEQAAGAVGEDPTADSARFAPVQSVGANAVIADAWINYSYCPCLNVMVGQYQAPFSMENRTGNNAHTWMERNLAIRGFVFPNSKELGITVWGELGRDKLVGYELGVFGGDGQNRIQVDNRPDFMGRVYARPLAKNKGLLDKAQLGMSAHHGQRDPDYVAYDYPAITTGSGFALWQPTYKDSAGRTVHVIPSGAQNEIGGELRVPIQRFEVRGEAYYVINNTREGIDGFQLTNIERLGRMRGTAWYVQLSAWPVGDPFVNGDPGTTPRPTHVDLDKKVEVKKGLEVFAIVASIDAQYTGASRVEGAFDKKTPGNPGTASKIKLTEWGLGASYWYTKWVRASFNYILYHAPDSATTENMALVPGNLGKKPDKTAHVLHEIGTRLAVWF